MVLRARSDGFPEKRVVVTGAASHPQSSMAEEDEERFVVVVGVDMVDVDDWDVVVAAGYLADGRVDPTTALLETNAKQA